MNNRKKNHFSAWYYIKPFTLGPLFWLQRDFWFDDFIKVEMCVPIVIVHNDGALMLLGKALW